VLLVVVAVFVVVVAVLLLVVAVLLLMLLLVAVWWWCSPGCDSASPVSCAVVGVTTPFASSVADATLSDSLFATRPLVQAEPGADTLSLSSISDARRLKPLSSSRLSAVAPCACPCVYHRLGGHSSPLLFAPLAAEVSGVSALQCNALPGSQHAPVLLTTAALTARRPVVVIGVRR
jgi:hypothetical protein